MASTNTKSTTTGYSAVLDDAERASRDEIIALQTGRMAWTLAHAYGNVAHYKKAFDAKGVHPSDFRQLSDLAKFPFTVKTDLRDNYPFNMFAVPREQLVRVHASSGTTGKPIVVGYTQADIDTWSDVMARSIRAAGGRSGMIMHNAYGYGLFTGGLGAHYGAERLGCTVVPVSGGMTERQVQLINDFKPDIITVTPSYMLAILDEFKKQGLEPRKSSLKFGIFGAEPWTNAMRAEIEQAFDMDATDIYGLSEVIGPGVAQECVETKDGLHIWEDHFYPEVVDPETGAVLPDGEKGELVFTSLTKQAFPIIRYRTRDLTRLLPGTARPGMRRMEKVTGRSDDMIILRGVNVFPTQIEEALLATDWCGGHFIIELTREGRMDEMTVLAEARPESWDGSGLMVQAEKVSTFIKNTIGISTQIRVVAPETLERSLGKAKRVFDKRPKNRFDSISPEQAMTEDISRRDILTSSVAAAVGAALPSLGACEFGNGPVDSVVGSGDRRRHPRQENNGNRRYKSRDRTRRAIERPQRLHFPEQGRCPGNGGRDR